MKKLTIVLLMTALMSGSAVAQNKTWTGASSTTLDEAGNWDSVPGEAAGTDNIRFDGYSTNLPNWPVIDSAIYHLWGVARARGPGLHLTQVGGYLEWLNGSGTSSRGFAIFSRPATYPIADEVHNPAVVRLLGGIMVTDAVGVGTTGGINSGSFYSLGGDYAEDTETYRNWQYTAPPRG